MCSAFSFEITTSRARRFWRTLTDKQTHSIPQPDWVRTPACRERRRNEWQMECVLFGSCVRIPHVYGGAFGYREEVYHSLRSQWPQLLTIPRHHEQTSGPGAGCYTSSSKHACLIIRFPLPFLFPLQLPPNPKVHALQSPRLQPPMLWLPCFGF